MVICRHCHADLAVPEAEPNFCGTCGAPLGSQALACVRCGSLVAPPQLAAADRDDPIEGDSTHPSETWPADQAAHVERGVISNSTERKSAAGLAGREPVEGRGSIGRVLWFSALAALGGEIALFIGLVRRDVLPWPRDWLDVRMTAWIVSHVVTFLTALLLAVLAAPWWTGAERRRVWSPGAIAFSAIAPSLSVAWMFAHLLAGLFRVITAGTRGAVKIDPNQPRHADRLLSTPAPNAAGWTWLACLEAVVGLGVSAALFWPGPWRPLLPPGLQAVIEAIQTAGPWLRWGLAVIGLGHILAAAFGWYWQTYEEGGLVTWLSPVVLLAPLLVVLSTALLTGLGQDIAGRDGVNLSHAFGDSLLLWGMLSLYGVYYLLTSWGAMRGFVILAALGYVLCGPMILSGWQTGRRQTHRLESGPRLSQLAAGLRRYAEAYQELPPPVIADPAGRPLYSWRVLLLPFIDEQSLYAQFQLNQPWDAPVNRRLLPERPELFRCDEFDWDDRESTLVSAVIGDGTFFPPAGGVHGSELRGHGEARLLLLEGPADQRRPWTAPNDPTLDQLHFERLTSIYAGPLQAVTANGTPVDVKSERGSQGNDLPVTQRFLRPSASTP